MKPIKEKLSKSQLADLIAEQCGDDSGLNRRQVQDVLDALGDVMCASICKGAVGQFTLPGLLRVGLKDRKAIKKGTMVRSFSGGMVPHKGRPASKVVKIRALAGLKSVVTS